MDSGRGSDVGAGSCAGDRSEPVRTRPGRFGPGSAARSRLLAADRSGRLRIDRDQAVATGSVSRPVYNPNVGSSPLLSQGGASQVRPTDGTKTLVIDCFRADHGVVAFKDRSDSSTPMPSALASLADGERAVVPSPLAPGKWPTCCSWPSAASARIRPGRPNGSAISPPCRSPSMGDGRPERFPPILGLAHSHKLTTYDAAYLELARLRESRAGDPRS